MSETTRRDLIRSLALAATLGSLPAADAQHVHNEVAEEKKSSGNYQPKLFTPHEYQTIQRLADLIIPADEVSKGALDAGAPEYIDLLASGNERLETLYRGGIVWLDVECGKRFGATFLESKPDQQTQLLDVLAYHRNETPENHTGVLFFAWTRRMVVDAFYTSKIGIEDVGFKGNVGMSKFQVPAEALQYALKRSGMA